ncbi:VWA domain-containing protein [Nibribacter ruber]|uniref:VWA domain-containing protein n=1 Tax=Nibribacter ruber TaxID=2698458 RepID=A0A6P1NUF8_9BACT|nr:VWA domain-containing protein [Nibribacter ruber]QHL86680.1 VWA domain-containing protein [Nibribacter ruber]
MTWYLPFTLLELMLCLLFLVLYGGYLYRIKRLAHQFAQQANTLWIKAALRTLYGALIMVALLGPSFGAMTKEIRTNGKDVLLAVDLSQSMKAADVSPSRLEKVKLELSSFIQQANSDRIGLMGFSSSAFIISPFTYDNSALELFIQSLKTNQAPPDAAQLAPVLNLTLQKFQDLESNRDKERTKILVIFSDGETFGENLQLLAQQMKNKGIHVFCVGVGTTVGAKIPEGRGYKKDKDGQTVITRLESDPLRLLAKTTQGDYFEMSQSTNELPRLVRAVNAVQSEVRQTKVIEVTANKYFYPLLAALLLIVLDVLWTLQVLRI